MHDICKKITKQSPITLVELPATQFGILNGEISFDEYSHSKLPSRALHVLSAVLMNDGWKNTAMINPIYHGKDNKLTKENFKRILSSNVLGISSITRTAPQSIWLAELYKANNPAGIVIAGGPDPTFRFEEWLRYVDVVVMGEGERTILDLMNQLMKNPEKLERVDGIAYKKNKKIIVTKPRRLLSPEELSRLPHPYYDADTKKKISVSVIETSRGCPNNCEFCGVTKFYGGTYRRKSKEWIIEELKRIQSFAKTIFYIDDNFVGSSKESMDQSIELLNAIADEGLNKRYCLAQVTIKAAKNQKLLRALKGAGISCLCIGIESINNETLRSLRKPYNSEQNKEAIKIFRKNGFWVHGMLMPGGDGDTEESLKELLKWSNENLDSVQFFPPGPLPGTDFHKRMEIEGSILTRDASLADGHIVCVRPKNFTPYQLQNIINKMYYDFYSWKNTFKRFPRSPNKVLTILLLWYTKIFGGIRKVVQSPALKNHIEFLKSIS